jgi:predicted nucleic acid-binding Zn ribbon protein
MGTIGSGTIRAKSLAATPPAKEFSCMAIYVYETIPASDRETVRTYEIRQSMKDPALTTHPETGEPIRRVITGGLGVITSTKGASASRPASGGHCCGGGCGCG